MVRYGVNADATPLRPGSCAQDSDGAAEEAVVVAQHLDCRVADVVRIKRHCALQDRCEGNAKPVQRLLALAR